MKQIVIAAIYFFSVFQLFSQNVLQGTILDEETKMTLPHATIFFPDLAKGTTTDHNGFYSIKNLPKGAFNVEVSYVGFSSKVIKIDVDGETSLNVALFPKITEMGEVVVTGTSSSTERKMNPIPTIVINNLSNYNAVASNIIDLISRQPGISQITTGPSISKPVIRGLGYNRVVVLNNHIRQEGQQWGDEHGIEIDEYSVEKVEIIKGPGSLVYGSDAMAGVINFIQPQPVQEGKIIGNLRTDYHANNNSIGVSAMTSGNLNGINWLIRLTDKQAGNYQNPYDGYVFNSAFKNNAVNGAVGINRKWGYSQLSFSNFSQKLGLIEGERDSLGNFIRQIAIGDSMVGEETVPESVLAGSAIEIPSQKINHLMVSANNKFFIKHSVIAVNIGFQQNKRKEFADVLNVNQAELFFKLNSLNYELRYVLPVKKGWETSAGISGMWQTSQNLGVEFLIPEYNLLDGGLFLFTQKSIDRLHFSGGMRFDMRKVDSKSLYLDTDGVPVQYPDSSSLIRFQSFESFFSSFSGSIGASYELSQKFIIKLNLAKGFRAPNISELGSNGVHEGTLHYEIGNPELKEESSLQVDAGFIYNIEHVSVELAGFVNSIQNFIFLEKLSSVHGGDSIVDTTDPVPAYQFIQGNSILYGGEIILDIHPHPLDWLHFENSFSYVRGIQLNQPDSTRNLPQIPAPEYRMELRGDFNKWGNIMKNIFLKIEWQYTFTQNFVFLSENTETPTPAYNLFNAGVGGDFVNRKGNTILTLSVAVSNIFNIGYQNHLSRLKYLPENIASGRNGVFDMGRNFSINGEIPINFRNPD